MLFFLHANICVSVVHVVLCLRRQATVFCFFLLAWMGGELLHKMNALPLVDSSSHERSKSNHKKIVVRKNSLHSLPRIPGQLIQRLNMLVRISRHRCSLTWEGACGWVWQVSEASRPPSSRISFSFGWWTVSNSTSFGRSGDTDANFCRRHGEHRHNARLEKRKANSEHVFFSQWFQPRDR